VQLNICRYNGNLEETSRISDSTAKEGTQEGTEEDRILRRWKELEGGMFGMQQYS